MSFRVGEATSDTNPLPIIPRGAGIVASANFTPAAAPYLASDILGTAQQFTFLDAAGDAVPAGSLIRITSAILKIDVGALQTSESAYVGQLYNAAPPSARVDNAAWTLAPGDLAAYLGDIILGTPVDKGSCLFVRTQFLDTDVKLIGSSLWMELMTSAAFTPTAVARQVTLQGIIL